MRALPLLLGLLLVPAASAAFAYSGEFVMPCELLAPGISSNCGEAETILNPGMTTGTYTATFQWTPTSPEFEVLQLTFSYCDRTNGGAAFACVSLASADATSPVTLVAPAPAQGVCTCQPPQFLQVEASPAPAPRIEGTEDLPTVLVFREPRVIAFAPDQPIAYSLIHEE